MEKPKTIAQIAKKYLLETENNSVGFGDTRFLDEIARRTTHTTLMERHPLDRHIAILNALDRSSLFRKSLFLTYLGNRKGWARTFELKEKKI